MRMRLALFVSAALLAAGAASAADKPTAAKPRTTAEILEASTPTDWRKPTPENTLYLDLAAGRVIIELAPRFAPNHVANIRKLVSANYFDGLSINRVQDNFVVQWGDANEQNPRPLGDAAKTLPAEFILSGANNIPFVPLPDEDGYAPLAGWVDGFPAARDRKARTLWMTHCYGTLGVGRDTSPDSGGGTELYVVIGQAPRQLDRNITVVGRALRGMEWLSSLPRGTAALGFYEKPEQRVPIVSIRLASSVPESERANIEVLRTDTATFTEYVEARRNRRDEWYVQPAGHIDVCNVAIPVR